MKIVFNTKEIQSTCESIGGIKLHMSGVDTDTPRLFLFLSCNGRFIHLFEIKNGVNGINVITMDKIRVGKSTNNITFGTDKYASFMMASCDNMKANKMWLYEDPVGTWETIKTDMFKDIVTEYYRRDSMMGSWIPGTPYCSIGTDSGVFAVYNFETGEQEALFHHVGPVRCIACCPNPKVPVLVYGYNNTISFVEVGTWKQKSILLKSSNGICGIAWKDDGSTLCIAYTNILIEYDIQVGIKSLKDTCIDFIAKTNKNNNWDLKSLPNDLELLANECVQKLHYKTVT